MALATLLWRCTVCKSDDGTAAEDDETRWMRVALTCRALAGEARLWMHLMASWDEQIRALEAPSPGQRHEWLALIKRGGQVVFAAKPCDVRWAAKQRQHQPGCVQWQTCVPTGDAMTLLDVSIDGVALRRRLDAAAARAWLPDARLDIAVLTWIQSSTVHSATRAPSQTRPACLI